MKNTFYTYAYLREDKTPYYIGKGTGKRAYKKEKREFKPPKDKSRIIFLKNNLTEEEAFKHEIYMISIFGRKNLGTGILRNKTDGGDGVSNPSPESRRKNSERNKRAYLEGKNPLSQFTSEERTKYTKKAACSRKNSDWLKQNPEYNGGSLGRTPEQHSKDSTNAIKMGCHKYWNSLSQEERMKKYREHGKIGAAKAKELDVGIFGMSKEERSRISKKKFEDPSIREKYREMGKKLYLDGKGIADPKSREKNRIVNLERTSKEFCVKDPNGKIYKGKGIKPFAREHGLPTTSFNSLVRGLTNNCRGWTRV